MGVAVVAAVYRRCYGEVCLAIWVAATDTGADRVAGAVADLAAAEVLAVVVVLAEVLVAAVILEVEVRVVAGRPRAGLRHEVC